MLNVTRNLSRVLFIFCLITTSYLGTSQPLYKPDIKYNNNLTNVLAPQVAELKIGDVVPDLSFRMVNYRKPNMKLSDVKGKLIILDFWSTTCSSCIANFPKLQTLQDSFGGKIEVVLVNAKNTGDTEDKIMNFYEKKKKSVETTILLPSVILDTSLNKLFTHRLIPHYVWIDSNRVVKAITSSKEVTSYNIKKILQSEAINLMEKRDLFDRETPLFKSYNFYNIQSPIYSSFFTKYIEGIGHGLTRSSNQVIKTQTLRNYRIIELYDRLYNFQYNRVILNVKDKKKYVDDNTEEWSDNNSYCYEISVPIETSDSIVQERMKQDINNNLNLNCRYEERSVSCFVLRPDKSLKRAEKNSIKSTIEFNEDNDTISYKNVALSEIIVDLNAGHLFSSVLKPIFEDESEFKDQKYSLQLSVNARGDIGTLKSELTKQGFDLIEIKRDLRMFVLSEN